jgi:hypothetical protein
MSNSHRCCTVQRHTVTAHPVTILPGKSTQAVVIDRENKDCHLQTRIARLGTRHRDLPTIRGDNTSPAEVSRIQHILRCCLAQTTQLGMEMELRWHSERHLDRRNPVERYSYCTQWHLTGSMCRWGTESQPPIVKHCCMRSQRCRQTRGCRTGPGLRAEIARVWKIPRWASCPK